MDLDALSVEGAVRRLYDESVRAVAALESELPYVAEATERIVRAFENGGRLFYVGAGTSGRLGILDASECPPTFGTPPEMVQGLIAGGMPAVFQAQEGAEDHEHNGADAIDEAGITDEDIVCGIAGSGRTPYVIGAVERAREIGAATLFVTCNPRERFDAEMVDTAVCVDIGAEPLMGSTRMNAGTVTKLVLNTFTTVAMVRLGKVYENMMVDLQPSNAKLVQRSRRVVMLATGAEYAEADRALKASAGHVKTAIVMVLAGVGAEVARERLAVADGFVRGAIEA
jgi:N-acetylmuramic acid 6-phosphate etherase